MGFFIGIAVRPWYIFLQKLFFFFGESCLKLPNSGTSKESAVLLHDRSTRPLPGTFLFFLPWNCLLNARASVEIGLFG